MAKQIQEIFLDDLDGSALSSENTIRFGLDGFAYEIDLSDKNEEKLRKALAPFLVKARQVRKERGGKVRRGVGSARTVSRDKSTEIRQWAKQAGLPVSERGRIAATIVEQYEAAH
ncbi:MULTISPECIES: histone-like nucleoid-structuring protein Lsr2 [Nonomuraea]|jgi:hypothetical protein|uniref:histone-like nucleoid-structuring protein Lsr2 n=1 Tax=Nonomuraea TaxID=83681 RepID=UPI001CDA42DA|nr:Lsr2 family protein [Nonomuraea aurantiaca]MCA2224892.1 Lsr2 family protein [Nonomuraea aurantiaca]